MNAVLISCIVAGDICYAILGELWLKGLTSSGFVALATVNLVYAIKFRCANLKFAIVMLVGFVLAMAGDIVLNIRNMFMEGALLFAVGHVFYFIAYCLLQKFKWIDLIPGEIILVPSVLVITLIPIFNFGGALIEVVCVVYAVIISLMLGKAISNIIRKKNMLNWLIVIGSSLFFLSDLMLLFDVFAVGISYAVVQIFDNLCLATYYPAQCLLAHSLMHLPQKKE